MAFVTVVRSPGLTTRTQKERICCAKYGTWPALAFSGATNNITWSFILTQKVVSSREECDRLCCLHDECISVSIYTDTMGCFLWGVGQICQIGK